MKKGFTLIELLAVIVILAIIVLIATPIVLDIIDDTKRESLELSAQNYIDAVELSISNKILNDSTLNLNGVYEIINSGKQIKKDEIILDVPINGDLPKEGYIVIENSKVVKLSGVKLGKWDVKISNKAVKLTQEKEKLSTLVTGQQFNEKIKTLANETSMAYTLDDERIISVEFYSDGILPNGYTKEKLEELPNVDVSLNGDITAYNDNGRIYVCSENIISFNQSSKYLFNKLKVVIEIKFLRIDTSNVTNMVGMFNLCNNLQKLDLKDFDTSKVTSMETMFDNCYSLSILNIDVNKFKTDKVTSTMYMFRNCKKLESIDVSKWNTSQLENMRAMFNGCRSFKTLNVSHFDTSNVTNMSYTFANCPLLTKLDLSKWNTDKVTTMDNMFEGTTNLKTIFVGSNFGASATKNNTFRWSKTATEEELCKPNSTEEWCTLEEVE